MSSQPPCWLGYGVMTFAIPCQGGCSPPPSLPPSPPPPPVPASTELPSPCWAPDTAELSYQHQEPRGQTCPAPNRHMGKRPFFPLFPVYRDADSSGFSLSLPGTEDGGEGEREMQPCAKPGGSQSHPGAPLNVHADCHHVHTGQRERVACLESGVVSGSWPCEGLSPPAWCSSWRRCKMAGKSP